MFSCFLALDLCGKARTPLERPQDLADLAADKFIGASALHNGDRCIGFGLRNKPRTSFKNPVFGRV